MPLTMRERILSVYRGKTLDVMPFMLDLSHWFFHRNRLPWDLTMPYGEPDIKLIECHRNIGAGFYVPILGIGWKIEYRDGVACDVFKETYHGNPSIVWRYTTPVGVIARRRVWEDISYSWPIHEWGVRTEQDIRILGYALSRRSFKPLFDSYARWVDAVGDTGVVYMPFGYSAMGQLMNAWMGVSETIYAANDWSGTVSEYVEQVNANNLELVDLLCSSKAEIVIMGDNFSSDIQPPDYFGKWSKAFYTEAVRRFHAAGKYVAVHIDGRLKGALRMIRETGADCADAVTPIPMGDLSPDECRKEAGNDFILVDDRGETFPTHDVRWLTLISSRRQGVGSEGVLLIPALESPDGSPLLVVCNEVSGTTTLIRVRPATDPPAKK